MATESDWVLVRYVGEQESRLGMVQALPRTKWDYLMKQYSKIVPRVWQVIAEGTQQEMEAFETLTGDNK